MSEVISQLKSLSVIAVASIERVDDALPLAEALAAGGLSCVEIVLRNPTAIDALERIAQGSDLLVGAGTVLTVDQVKAAEEAGARFMVSPGFNPKIARYCIDHRIDHFPGVCTPTEVEAALEMDLRILKFFPAEACGGIAFLKVLSGPYSQVEFIPTGGINAANLDRYLRFPKVFACGGTWIAETSLVHRHRFDEITNNARQAVTIARQCRRTT